MAAYLGLSPETFTSTYCQQYDQVPGWRLLKSATSDARQAQGQFEKQQQEQPLQYRQQSDSRLPAVSPLNASKQQWEQHRWQQQQQQDQEELAVQNSNDPSQQQQQQQQVVSLPKAEPPSSLRIACIFLDQSTNSCTVHPVRPLQCSSYPWWPELMPQQHWQQEKGASDASCYMTNLPEQVMAGCHMVLVPAMAASCSRAFVCIRVHLCASVMQHNSSMNIST
jgi:Fe-S-cluster containining protein